MTKKRHTTGVPARRNDVEPGPTNEVIAKLAELLWEQAGRPPGREAEFRQRAVAELKPAPQPAREEHRAQDMDENL